MFPLLRKSLWIGNPRDGFRVRGKLFVDGHARLKAKLFVISRGARDELRFLVARIGLPGERGVFRENGKPCEAAARANAVINETILTITPLTERHVAGRICIDDVVCPARRNDDDVTGFDLNGEATARIFRRFFLTVNDGASVPEFEKFGSGPARMRRDGVNVALTAHRLLTELSLGVNDDAEEKHFFPQNGGVFPAADVHSDVIDRIGAVAIGVEEAFANVV